MIRPITQSGDEVLRKIAKEIPLDEISSPKVQKVIQDMKDTLRNCEDGLAIAAPQIGEQLSIFVVSGRFFPPKSTDEGVAADGEEETPPAGPDLVFINPKITRRSSKKSFLEEGCLSVRWLYGEIERAEKVMLHAHDESGKKITRGASGLLAQVFQHETDHLNGILFIDSAENVHEVLPESDEHKARKRRHERNATHSHDHDDHDGHSH